MVVYQALYGSFSVWVRLSMFMEEVDHEKYPMPGKNTDLSRKPGQTAREPVPAGEKAEAIVLGEDDEFDIILLDSEEEDEPPAEAAVSPLLLEFLDTESFEERMAILQRMKGKAGQREVDSLCLCLDVETVGGDDRRTA